MKTKLEMAHEFTLDMIKTGYSYDQELLDCAWAYADAMQAEADKREKKTSCDTNVNFDMYLEYDASINYPPDAWVMYKGEKRLAVSIDTEKEWQPDWSQAPDVATHWTMRQDGKCLWWKGKPLFDGSCFYDAVGICHTVGYAPSFGYHSDWRNSLRKRPK